MMTSLLFLLVVMAVSRVDGTDGDCADPEGIGNGFVVSRGPYFNGSFASYTCQNGYSMTGAAVLECVYQVWQGSLPTCTIYEGDNNAYTNTVTSDSGVVEWALIGLAVILLIAIIIATIFAIYYCCCRRKSEGSRARVDHYNDYDYDDRRQAPPRRHWVLHGDDYVRTTKKDTNSNVRSSPRGVTKVPPRVEWVKYDKDYSSPTPVRKTNLSYLRPSVHDPSPKVIAVQPAAKRVSAVKRATPGKMSHSANNLLGAEDLPTSKSKIADKTMPGSSGDKLVPPDSVPSGNALSTAKSTASNENVTWTPQPAVEQNATRPTTNAGSEPRMVGVVNDLNQTRAVNKPVRVWMPHSNPVRNYNTSTR